MGAIEKPIASVAELADALDLGSSGETRAGSIPVTRTSYANHAFTNQTCWRQRPAEHLPELRQTGLPWATLGSTPESSAN